MQVLTRPLADALLGGRLVRPAGVAMHDGMRRAVCMLAKENL
jgi:hypothetical protein